MKILTQRAKDITKLLLPYKPTQILKDLSEFKLQEPEFNIEQVKESIEQESLFIRELSDKVHEVIVGQADLVQKLILAILADGHVFLEGFQGSFKGRFGDYIWIINNSWTIFGLF